MDSKGWIDISLLASFNRVKALTSDYQLVREVLMLSTLVQVREHHVRMGGWERFVLPDAPKSTVENEEGYSSSIPQHQHPLPSNNMYTPSGEEVDMTSGVPGVPQPQTHRHHSGGAGEGEGDEEIEVDEEDEEDDVVFVMGQNGGEGMWSHEKRT
ncbi:hypothetical protein AN958_00058 [Leucoagaricus sp. SymC.cos]|nr:hypothetical protein AN958_00058 [Leucoagaricus sp. SymC.cos]